MDKIIDQIPGADAMNDVPKAAAVKMPIPFIDEQALAKFCGARHVIACANGTDALNLALRAVGIGAGDAVIVPAFSFSASAEAVVIAGATPVFCDVLPDNCNIDT